MTKNAKSKTEDCAGKRLPTKHQQIIDLLQRDGGSTLEEISALANWLPHSTRAFMTTLKKKGYVVDSKETDGIRRYRIVSTEEA